MRAALPTSPATVAVRINDPIIGRRVPRILIRNLAFGVPERKDAEIERIVRESREAVDLVLVDDDKDRSRQTQRRPALDLAQYRAALHQRHVIEMMLVPTVEIAGLQQMVLPQIHTTRGAKVSLQRLARAHGFTTGVAAAAALEAAAATARAFVHASMSG